ncbi:MAG: hypothetical protein M3540_03555 [Actinomycetota bacterium]|nr:hypothetical protein [Actinomycetota bacterium]
MALAAVVALVLASSATPGPHANRVGQQSSTQELVVVPYDSRLGSVNADTGFALVFPATQPAPAKVVVFVPGGYGLDLGVPAGTTIGTVNAATTAGATRLRGNVVVDSPTRFTADPAAIACAGPAQHAAAWVLQLAVGATSVPVVVFIDPTSGTETGLGVYKLQACFTSPDAGAPRITDLYFELTRGVTNPSRLGAFAWGAFVTPFVAGTTNQNPAGTVEVRSIVPLPQVLTLKGKYDRKKKSIVLSGALTLAGQKFAGVDVDVYGSTKPAPSTFKRLGRVKTKTKQGTYSFRRKTAKTMYFGVLVDEYFTGARCESGPSVAPAGCIQENISIEVFSRLVKVTVPAKKK